MISTLTRPGNPSGPEQVALAARLPDHAGVDECAGLDGLERVDLDAGRDVRLLLDDAFVADDGTLFDPRATHDVGVLADDAATQIHLRTDEQLSCTTARCKNAPLFTTTLLPRTVYSRSSAPAFDLRVVADVERALQDRLGVDLGALAHPDTRHHLEALDVDVDLPVQHICLHLQQAFQGADVLPVGVGHVAEDRGADVEQFRKDVRDQSTDSPAATYLKISGSMM